MDKDQIEDEPTIIFVPSESDWGCLLRDGDPGSQDEPVPGKLLQGKICRLDDGLLFVEHKPVAHKDEDVANESGTMTAGADTEGRDGQRTDRAVGRRCWFASR